MAVKGIRQIADAGRDFKKERLDADDVRVVVASGVKLRSRTRQTVTQSEARSLRRRGNREGSGATAAVVVAESALFFAGAALGSIFLGSTFGWPALAIAAALATGLHFAAGKRWAGRAWLVRPIAATALLSLYGVWAYLAIVFGWLLAWTISSAFAVAILSMAVVALVTLRRPIAGMRVPLVLPLGAWIAVCLLGWVREDGVIRCGDYLRFRSDPSVTLAWVQDVVALHDERDVLRARDRTLLERPADVRAYFQAQFRTIVKAKAASAPAAPAVSRLRPTPADDPYGF